jgi:predicted acetyltransferase
MVVETPLEVSLEVVTESDAAVLRNLLELYIHDMSEVFPGVEVGADGRFGYHKLPLYWSEPERCFAYLIRRAGKLAGFILATRGSPISEDPDVLDIAEFFVLRGLRRARVGWSAAALLWGRLPGRWTVRVSEGNSGALPFWARAIAEYTGGQATWEPRPGTPNAWRVFSFESAAR